MNKNTPIVPDTPTVVFTVEENTYLDNGKLIITNNGQSNAIVFGLIIEQEEDDILVKHNGLIQTVQSNKTITIALDKQLKSGTQVIVRSSFFNITATVEGVVIPDMSISAYG